jgi:hypothetical protein
VLKSYVRLYGRLADEAVRSIGQGWDGPWLDMESSPYVDATLALFRRLRERGPGVGVARQSSLHRTERATHDIALQARLRGLIAERGLSARVIGPQMAWHLRLGIGGGLGDKIGS